MHELLNKKHTGVLFPLFSMRSRNDWGIGDIKTMELWFDNLKAMNINLLQVLPMNEMPAGVSCPYTALSAFAIDPIYISIESIPELSEFEEIKNEINSNSFQENIVTLRNSSKVLYNEVRFTKFTLLWKIYEAFKARHINNDTPLAKEFKKFSNDNAYWLDDYALFRRLKDINRWASWTQWEQAYRDRNSNALRDLYNRDWLQITYFKYMQWCIHRQWSSARLKAAEYGIKILGDLPFMVNQESADVWARRGEFDLTKEAGAPPDSFSADGQHWGLPAYNWPEHQKNNFEWWRLKVQYASEYYDFFRVDHMVGFFRTWVIPFDRNIKANFDILDPVAQRKRGKEFLQAVAGASKMLPVAEDLGVIPPYVGEVLAELNIPGYKIMRWEQKGGKYKDPKDYFPISIGTTSTHDMETMADWWETPANNKDKAALWEMISGTKEKAPAFSKAKDLLLKKLLNGSSKLIIIPIQDIVGSKERTNLPNSVGDHNWTYRYGINAEDFFKKQTKLISNFSKAAAVRL